MSSLLNILKTIVSSNIFIYTGYLKISKPGIAKNLPSNETDLFIAAYPRSGNDYAKHLTKKFNPDIKISSHFHRIGALKLAIKLSVPVIGIIRDPLECISSSMVKYKKECNFNKFPTYPIFDYIFFHQALLKHVENITLVNFYDLINKPLYYYSILENELKLRSNYNLGDINTILNEIDNKLNSTQLDCNQTVETKKGPDPLKERMKAEAKNIICHKKNMKNKALNLYQELLKYS